MTVRGTAGPACMLDGAPLTESHLSAAVIELMVRTPPPELRRSSVRELRPGFGAVAPNKSTNANKRRVIPFVPGVVPPPTMASQVTTKHTKNEKNRNKTKTHKRTVT